jgi:iron complex outermembrane receptor protein
MIERTLAYTSDAGAPDVERYETEPGYPDWTGSFRSSLDFNDWRIAYSISYISRVDQDPDFLDTWSNASGVVNEDGNTVRSDTCDAPTLCRDIGFIKSQTIHNISLYYRADTFTAGIGVRNAFDTEPPFVDHSEIFAYSNVPLGYGYNIFGQEVFFNFNYSF